MGNQDKAAFQRRRLLESRYNDKKPEKKKSDGSKFLLIAKAQSEKIEKAEKSPREPFFHSRKRVIITAVILIIVLVGAGGFGWYEWQQYQISQNPAVIYAKKLKSITDIVSEQIALPKGEQPIIATVTDVTKLPKEAFFKEAQDGDKVLMYKKHKEAILYRPTTGQVIAEAELDFENAAPAPIRQEVVAGASTSAVILGVTPVPASSSSSNFVPQGKILVQPQQ